MPLTHPIMKGVMSRSRRWANGILGESRLREGRGMQYSNRGIVRILVNTLVRARQNSGLGGTRVCGMKVCIGTVASWMRRGGDGVLHAS